MRKRILSLPASSTLYEVLNTSFRLGWLILLVVLSCNTDLFCHFVTPFDATLIDSRAKTHARERQYRFDGRCSLRPRLLGSLYVYRRRAQRERIVKLIAWRPRSGCQLRLTNLSRASAKQSLRSRRCAKRASSFIVHYATHMSRPVTCATR